MGGMGGFGGKGGFGGRGGFGGMPPGFGGMGPGMGMPPGYPGGMGGMGGMGMPRSRPSAPPKPLDTLRPGDRVLVTKLRTEGAVTENDVEGKTMMVQLDGGDDILKFAYKNLEAVSTGGGGGGPPFGRDEPDDAPPPAPKGAAAELAKLGEGDRVKVMGGRNFDKFHGGMVGTIVTNNVDSRNILIKFDNTKVSGPEPLQVAYRHLEPA